MAKEKAHQQMLARIEKEVEDRVAKADEAFETLKSEARERAKDPERLAAIQSIIDEERAKHAASKHAHACEYARGRRRQVLRHGLCGPEGAGRQRPEAHAVS